MIVVFGSINLDLVARVPRLPRPGETLRGSTFAALPGGKGANQALAARLAGADVALVGAVGRDAFAETAQAALRTATVDLSAVAAVDAPTGVAMIHIDDAGENAITVIAGANAAARAAAIMPSHWARASLLLLQLEVPLAEVTDAAREARGRGVRVVLNAAPMQSLPRTLLDNIDVLVVNELEAAALAAQAGVDAGSDGIALALSRQLHIEVVVTEGARGAQFAAAGGHGHARPPARTVVDTTGAGDAFTGALASALDRRLPWSQVLAFAVAAGTLACSRIGAQSALADGTSIANFARQVESIDCPQDRPEKI